MAKNVWTKLEKRLREVLPYPYPEKDYRGNPISPEEREGYYDALNDPLINFLIGNGAVDYEGVEFVECEGSHWEHVNYDDCPQGLEDDVYSIILVDGVYYKVSMYYRSNGGHYLYEEAHVVNPKTVEVVVYE